MTTKQRFLNNKVKLQVREKDHLPMHVHLVGGIMDAEISLETLEVVNGTVPPKLLKEVLEWISEHKEELIEEWKKWHK